MCISQPTTNFCDIYLLKMGLLLVTFIGSRNNGHDLRPPHMCVCIGPGCLESAKLVQLDLSKT